MRTTTGVLAAVLALATAAGCAGSKAGKAAASYADPGAAESLEGTVPDLAARAEQVMRERGITIANSMTADSGLSHVLEGVRGNTSVRITVTREGADLTRVEVLALRTNELDQDYARKLLEDIARA